jgi:hypothetical protein
MKTDHKDLNRSEKILLFLYEFGNGGKTKIRYEDIVVGLFKKYPHDFHLKGHPEHPDSGDLIHKPLYDFKKKGYVNALTKVFSLTDRGIELAEQLSGKKSETENKEDRLSRGTETEVSRVKSLEGFSMFLNNKQDELSDNDFYNYLGVTVRTQKNAFIGRLESLKAVINELKSHNDENLYKSIIRYHDFLISRYQDVTDYFTKN